MRLLVVAAIVCALGCSSRDDAAGPPADAGAPTMDALDPHAPYPAAHPALPQLQNAGGPTMAAMQIVAVTFAGEPHQAELEAFVSKLGASGYWKTITAEYGVGPATAGPPVHETIAPPAVMSASGGPFGATAKWVKDRVEAAGSSWPAPTASTAYVVFVPSTTTIDGAYGFHTTFVATSGAHVPFAVVGRAPPFPPTQGGIPYPALPDAELDRLTGVGSHELAEIATDVDPYVNPAWSFLDAANHAPEALGYVENGDLCESVEPAYVSDPEVGAVVARTWSNSAAAAGHDPCVPAVGAPYFAAVPVVTDDVTIAVPVTGSVATKGVKMAPGQSKTIDVALFSDAPSDAWSVTAVRFYGQPPVDATFDRATGANGDVLRMTIQPLDPDAGTSSVVGVLSTLGGRSSLAFVAVGR